MRHLLEFSLGLYFIFAAHTGVAADPPTTGAQAQGGLVTIQTYDPFLSVGDKNRGSNARSHWSLCFAEGDLHFFTDGATRPPAPDAPDFPNAGGELQVTFLFREDGTRLRFFVPGDRLKLKDQASKQGWYLTGDYSTDPPSVILTKEPTKYSNWQFLDPVPRVGEDNGKVCYVKNENDRNKDGWLYFEGNGTVYKHSEELRKPILSHDKKVLFGLWRFPGGR